MFVYLYLYFILHMRTHNGTVLPRLTSPSTLFPTVEPLRLQRYAALYMSIFKDLTKECKADEDFLQIDGTKGLS